MNVSKATTVTAAATASQPAPGPTGTRSSANARLFAGAVLMAILVAAGVTTLAMHDGGSATRAQGLAVIGATEGRPAAAKLERLQVRVDEVSGIDATSDLMAQIHAVTGAAQDATWARTRLYQELKTSR